MQTVGKVDWLYGRIEVRAKLPAGRGIWPAIWMMPTDGTSSWPACGEIDIMEYVGFEPDKIFSTIHTKSFNHTIHTEKQGIAKVAKCSDTFHNYAMEWDTKKISFYVDDIKHFTFHNDGKGNDSWPFDKPFYLRVNMAVGGSWGGMKGIDDTIFPQKLYLDFVRVYTKKAP